MAENVVFKFIADGLRQFQTNVTSSFGKIKKQIQSVQGALATLGVGLSIRALVTSIADFEDAMAEVKAISEATGQQFAELQSQAIDLAKNSRFAAREVAAAQAELARGGLAVNAILAATPATLALAAAGQLALGEAAEIAVTSLNQFNLEATETGRVADVLAAGANKTTAEVAGLARGLGQVGPVANALGLDLEQTVALLGALSDGGLKSQRAGTGLRSVLGALSSTSAQGDAILAKYNLTLADLNLKTNSVETVLDRLAPIVENVNDAFVLVGTEGVAALSVLVNSRDGLADLDSSLRDVEGSAQRVSDVFEDSLGGALRSFKSQLDGITQEQGQAGLSNILRSLVDLGKEGVAGVDSAAKAIGVYGQLLGGTRKEAELANVPLAELRENMSKLLLVTRLLEATQDKSNKRLSEQEKSAQRVAQAHQGLAIIAAGLQSNTASLSQAMTAAGQALRTYADESATTATEVSDLELFVAKLRGEFELQGLKAPPSLKLIEDALKRLAATKGGAESIAKEVDAITVAAKAAAAESGGLSDAAKALFDELSSQTAEVQGRGAAVVEVFEKLGDTINATPGLGGALLKEAEDILEAGEKIGVKLPADFQKALEALRRFGEPGVTILSKLRKEEKSLEKQSKDLAQSIEEAAKSGEASTFVLAGLGDAAESLAKKYEDAGLSIPSSIQKVVDSLGDLNAASENVIGDALERQQDLAENLSALGETVDSVLLRNRGDADPFLLAAILEQVEDLDEEFEALGIVAPKSFQDIKEKVDEFALGVEAATGKMRGLRETTEDLSGLRQEYEKLLAQFNQEGLSSEDLNRFNELEIKVGGLSFSPDAERDMRSLRDQIAGNLAGGFGSLTGEAALADARNTLQKKGRLTEQEQQQLDALDKAAAAAGQSVGSLAAEQEALQGQQALTNEILETGNETVQALGDSLVGVGGQYASAARGAENLENTIRRGNVATGEAAARQQESIGILERLQAQRRKDTAATEGQAKATENYADAAQAGADATAAQGEASENLVDSLGDQASAAAAAGNAGEAGGKKAATGQRTAEEAARENLEALKDIEAATARITTTIETEAPKWVSAISPVIAACKELRDCWDSVGKD